MKTNYKSSKRKNTKTNRSKKRKSYNQNKPYLFYIIVIAMILFGLYKIAPEAIEFKIIVDDATEDSIRRIVKEEVEKSYESMLITEEQPVATEILEPSVSSRGGDRETTPVVENKLTGYRTTSYYPGDGCASTAKTGSGKTTADFGTTQIGNKTVYTYKGKVVVAAATNELLRSGYSKRGAQEPQDKHYFSYYDEIKLVINGNTYEAIVLDSCGASMWKGEYRIDIFVPSASNVVNASNVEVIL